MKSLLFLAHRIPYPPNKGDKIRSYNLLKHLATHYRIHLGAFIDDPDDLQHMEALDSLVAERHLVTINPGLRKLMSLRGLLTGEALTVPYYRHGGMRQWVAQQLANPDIKRAFVYSSSMAQYIDNSPAQSLRRLIDFVDIDSDKWRQYAEKQSWPMNVLYRRESRTLLSYEKKIAAAFDVSAFVSEAEAALFRELAGDAGARVTHFDNGVDADYFSPLHDYESPYAPEDKVLVFTGAMDYWANVDAVAWFARHVFEAVRARVPQARFCIVGSRPTQAVRSLEAHPGIDVTGSVPDVRPYLAYAHAAVAPLRIARGVQNKVLEAMAMERPVLATTPAMDGITLSMETGLRVTDNPTEQVEAAVRLLSRDNALASKDAAARDNVIKHYDWGTNVRRVAGLIEGNHATSSLSDDVQVTGEGGGIDGETMLTGSGHG